MVVASSRRKRHSGTTPGKTSRGFPHAHPEIGAKPTTKRLGNAYAWATCGIRKKVLMPQVSGRATLPLPYRIPLQFVARIPKGRGSRACEAIFMEPAKVKAGNR